jgi:A/G-specific adenine glycosylase
MDYGVKLKKEFKNPSRKSAHHVKQSRFEGSNRQVRGRIVALLLKNPELSASELSRLLDKPLALIEQNLAQLAKEGFSIIS